MPTIEEIQEKTNELMKEVIANCLVMGASAINMEYYNGVTDKNYIVVLAITEDVSKNE